MALSTVADYKAYAGITASTWDTQLGVILTAAQKTMERYCNCDSLEAAAYTEYHDGQVSELVVVRNVPINSVTSVILVSVDGSETTVDSDDYTYNSLTGVISFKRPSRGLVSYDDWGYPEGYGDGVSPNFGYGFRNVKVTYNGGHSSVPADLKFALYRLMDYMFATAGKDQTLSTETLGSYSYSRAFTGEAYGKMLDQICGPWKRVVVA